MEELKSKRKFIGIRNHRGEKIYEGDILGTRNFPGTLVYVVKERQRVHSKVPEDYPPYVAHSAYGGILGIYNKGRYIILGNIDTINFNSVQKLWK